MCDLFKLGISKNRCTPVVQIPTTALFRLGNLYATPGALAMLEKYHVNAAPLLGRHQCGDFGSVGADSVRDNQLAIAHGSRILSAYRLINEQTLMTMTSQEKRRSPQCWIITEADRSSTTILLPDEY